MRNFNAVIIYGAGSYGKLAYYYYKNRKEIKCYVDIDPQKWGKDINGILIYPPDILKQKSVKVIIAVKYGADDIAKQIKNDYELSDVIVFNISEKSINEKKNGLRVLDKNTCIVALQGGLGNQMFQYAFIKALGRKRKVYGDLSFFKTAPKEKFELTKTFRKISLDLIEDNEIQELKNRICSNDLVGNVQFLIYNEPVAMYETDIKYANKYLLESQGGIFRGGFQSCKYAETVKKELISDLSFDESNDKKLHNLLEYFLKNNIVGIHIRRGDYLSEQYRTWYEGICTEEYYEKAIRYMREHIMTDFIPCFFSDDIEWVKTHFKMDGALYIDEKMFDEYEDWYDMLLMSKCSHNIIANSTFSWWGAWLNRNEQKIVIAPEKWVNGCDYLDIYPKEWIKV